MRKIGTVVVLTFLNCAVSAQAVDPEWPCVQALIPEISIGTMWPEVIDPSLAGSWREDDSLTDVVNRLSDLDEFTESERELIADFSETLTDDTRKDSLNKLAIGIVEESNDRRSLFINGIKRYTRQQISIAGQIESTLNELAAMEGKTDEDSIKARAEIEETLHWHQRVYDQREHSMQALCERPVELEEKLSDVLRELAQHLP